MSIDLYVTRCGCGTYWLGRCGIRRNYGCRCGILYAPMLEVVFYAGLVSLTSSFPSPCSPYSSELIGGFFFCSASRILLCVFVRRYGALFSMGERTGV